MLSNALYRKLLHTLAERSLLADQTVTYVENLSVQELVHYQFVQQKKLYPVIAEVIDMRFVIPDQTWTYIHHEQDALLAQQGSINWLIVSDPFDVHIIDSFKSRFDVHRIGLSAPTYIQQFVHKSGVVITADLWTQFLEEAVNVGATDIHFLHDDPMIHVQFRVHGVLKEHALLGREKWGSLINQIKIRALLDITETRRAQTGHIQGIFAGHTVNCRVAIHPTLLGETITIRILYQHHHVDSLAELGFQDGLIYELNQIIEAPSGLFLITGPTGSGKTTTLYSLFRQHLKNRKIMTLEDPVEYVLPPIQQTEIQHADVFSYHDGLKSILRHDPDIIFVGEIRDKETAELTLRAAMTGHLVCATTHTHAAIDALYRFLDFGISQPALGTQLLGVLAQQLHPSKDGLALEAELLLCDEPIRQHLMANRPLYELPTLLTSHNHLRIPFQD